MPEVVKVLCLNQALLMVFVEVSNQNVFFFRLTIKAVVHM